MESPRSMVIGFALVLLLVNFSVIEIPDLFLEFSSYLHQICLKSLPPTETLSLKKALICGRAFSDFETKELLSKSGLAHLFIVSGAHLYFIRFLMIWCVNFVLPTSLKKPVVYLGLTFFVLVTGLNPPVFRAFIQISLSDIQRKKRLFWTALQLVFYSSIITLVLFPHWIDSYSFQLSWMASLTIAILLELNIKNQIMRQSIIYISLFPLLSRLSPPHPISILVVLLATPLFAFIIFPLTFIVFLIPSLDFLLKYLSNLFFETVKQILLDSPQLILDSKTDNWMNWILIWGVHLIYQILSVKIRIRNV